MWQRIISSAGRMMVSLLVSVFRGRASNEVNGRHGVRAECREETQMKSKALIFLIAAVMVVSTTVWAGNGGGSGRSGSSGQGPSFNPAGSSGDATPQGQGMRRGQNEGSSQGQGIRKRDGSCPGGNTPTQDRTRAKDGSGSGSKARRGGRS